MIDARNKLIELAEQALHSFVKMRLIDMGIEDSWKNGLSDFVNDNYREHPANYEKLYVFLQTHDEQEVTLEQMDITALSALVHFYWKSKGIYAMSPDAEQLFINQVQEMRQLRNTFDHYPQVLTEIDRKNMYYDQLYYSACISNFAVLVMKYKKPSEEWKQIYHKAKAIESQLQGEHWLDINSMPNSVLDFDEDLSDLIALAEQGQVEAQIKIAKAYYYGQRVKKDRGKAFYWFTKATEQKSIVACCYLARFFQPGSEVKTIYEDARRLIKSYAEKGFAPAQYEYGMTFCSSKYSTEEEKRDYIKWIELSAKQDYPEALSMLSIIHSYGKNFDLEKSKDLSRKAASLGEVAACLALAKNELMQGNFELALHWCNLAKTQDVDMIKEIEETKKRIMRKKNDEDKH